MFLCWDYFVIYERMNVTPHYNGTVQLLTSGNHKMNSVMKGVLFIVILAHFSSLKLEDGLKIHIRNIVENVKYGFVRLLNCDICYFF